jgi:hypothetical protein
MRYGTLGSPRAEPSTTAAKPTTGAIGGLMIGHREPRERRRALVSSASSAAAREASLLRHADGAALLELHHGFGGCAPVALAGGQCHSLS